MENKLLEQLYRLYESGKINKEEYLLEKQKLEQNINQETNTSIQQEKLESDNKNFLNHLVEIKNVTKKYKGRSSPAINQISFKIYPGHFHVFIGANGAGKTTTIKSIIGAYSKYKMDGEILIKGLSNQKIESKKHIGYVPEAALFPKKMTTMDYLVSMASLSGYSYKDSKILAKELLNKINMTSFAKKRPNTFSSGQKKKILLAQALIHNPEILIMDEPAANLDPIARNELFEVLIKLQQEGKAIFISSHILDEIGKYATYATILDGGKIVFDGIIDKTINLSELYKQHVKFGSVDN